MPKNMYTEFLVVNYSCKGRYGNKALKECKPGPFIFFKICIDSKSLE